MDSPAPAPPARQRLRAGLPLLLATLAAATRALAQAEPADAGEGRFEPQVRAYEEADRADPPPAGAILLAGDSQFHRWETLREDLPGYTLVNRGIDSFQMSDLVQYVDRLVVPHRPRLILLHVGGNDIHHGRSPEQVLADFREFVTRVRAALPGVPVVFSSITPGPGRWDEADRRQAANRLVRHYAMTQRDLHFIDLWSPMLKPDGKPREDLWVADRVHPNRAGYLLRAELTRPFLGEPDRKK